MQKALPGSLVPVQAGSVLMPMAWAASDGLCLGQCSNCSHELCLCSSLLPEIVWRPTICAPTGHKEQGAGYFCYDADDCRLMVEREVHGRL